MRLRWRIEEWYHVGNGNHIWLRRGRYARKSEATAAVNTMRDNAPHKTFRVKGA